MGTSDLPGAAWPGGAGADEWPRGRQPAPGSGWARFDNGLRRPCWKTSVLADVNLGWPGHCDGMSLIDGVAIDGCREGCEQSTDCPAWTFTADMQCWWGHGVGCWAVADSQGRTMTGGQRLQHGEVTVLQDMSGWEVHNLLSIGMFPGNGTENVQRCRTLCYSDIDCTYWAFGAGGCFVERGPSHVAAFPLTAPDGASDESIFARTSRAGEYVQHYCPLPPGASPTTTFAPDLAPVLHVVTPAPAEVTAAPAEDEGDRWKFGYVSAHPHQVALVAAGLVLSCLCLVCLSCCRRSAPKKRALVAAAREISTDAEDPVCNECGGSGRDFEIECYHCGGTGRAQPLMSGMDPVREGSLMSLSSQQAVVQPLIPQMAPPPMMNSFPQIGPYGHRSPAPGSRARAW